ncbi:transporter [Ralstonia solanacearum]|nr:transporter [Ralstonia solanacearum]
MPRIQHLVAISAGIAMTVLAGCASYRAMPLPTAPTAQPLSRVSVDPSKLRLPALASRRFDPADGLDITEVAMLAVANNPDLRLARDDLGIARAQAFAAGLLPDPQLGIANDYPSPSQPGATRAFNYGVSMDIMALAMRPYAKQAANANVAKIDLGLLWQEFQTAAQARRLFVKVRAQDAVLPLLYQARELTGRRYAVLRQAVERGNVAADTVTSALTAAQDARKQYADAQHATLQAHEDLNALLGLPAGSTLPLVDGGSAPRAQADATPDALDHLPERRADLLALAQGYAAEDTQYRTAILKQFPSLTVGFVRARDTSSLYTTGFQINLTLPIFNRNRGNIAIETATRQRLHDEYENRLNQAYADIKRLQADRSILVDQLNGAEAALPALTQLSDAAQHALDAHDITLVSYTDDRMAWIAKAVEVATLREALAEQDITLDTLLGITAPADLLTLHAPASHHD